MPPLLRMTGISKRFGPTQALRDVSFEVHAGQATALIGENGAGKSTLMKVLSGAISSDAGVMELAGKPYAPHGPHDAQRAGVAMIYQELNLAPDLSVQDNIMLGQERSRVGILLRAQQRRQVRDALELLGHPELEAAAAVRRLSVGAQQLVEIARALVAQARLIVFDEPTSSLTQADTERLFAVIGKLCASGIGIIYISHFLEEIRRVCRRYLVLRDGESVDRGDLADTTEARIVSAMVGRTVGELFPTVPHTPGAVVLTVRDLAGERLPRGVSFDLRRGEILGVAGLVGAGRTELLRAIYRLDSVRRGEVRVAHNRMHHTPRSAIRLGLGFVSEDRKAEGLAQIRSIADNLTYSRLAPYSRFGWLNLRRRRGAVEAVMTRMQIKAEGPDQSVAGLSGGNQQKVALARLLHQDADVMLLDEPTRGIDVGTKTEIYRWMGQAAAGGKAILFVSSYLPELMAVCDRIAVVARGRLRDVRAAAEWTQEEVMACAVGGEDNPEEFTK
jgi:ribose transport system ATP-binding protein